MRTVKACLAGLSVCLLLATPAFAASQEVAKVYRDYPGYINPAVCDNPNLDNNSTQPAAPDATSGETPPADNRNPACEPAPYALRSDDPVGIFYLTPWAAVVATSDADLDYAGGSSDVTFDTGYGAGLAAGYDFGPARLEIEGSYRRNKADQIEQGNASFDADGDLEVRALLVNAYADFATGGMVTPYLGAGIGYAEVEVEDHDDEVFAGQVGAGVLFALTPAIAVDLGYRFMMTDDPEIQDVEFEVRQHSASLGLQLRF
jgi:opacity protein-like surface antigen